MAKKQNPQNDPLQGIDLSALSDTLLSGMAKPQPQQASKSGIASLNRLRQNENGWYDVPLELIEEDPNQPRKDEDFDRTKLQELANSIQSIGLTQPISIRKHPAKPDMYMIHTGARRFRAFHILKRKTIPATFAKSASKAGQIVENHQREPLKPKAMLEFIAESQEEGIKLNDIASRIGVAPSYISMFKKILDTNIGEMRLAFEQERFTNITPAYDLLSLAKKHEKDVREYLTNFLAEEEGEITRGMVKKLKQRLENPTAVNEQETNAHTTFEHQSEEAGEGRDENENENAQQPAQDEDHGEPPSTEYETNFSGGQGDGETVEDRPETGKPDEPQAKPAKVYFIGEHNNETVTILAKAPSGRTKALIKLPSGEEREVPIKSLTLLRIWSE